MLENVLAYTLGVLIVALGIAISIALHEIGHLVPAKRFGVRVTQYMVGFGPTVWSRVRGETEYGVKAVPLGGYIRMIGMFPPRRGAREGTVSSDSSNPLASMIESARATTLEELRPGDENRTFYSLKVWQKLVVMLGGPLMNLVLAAVLLAITVSTVGLAQQTTRVQSVSGCILPFDAPVDAECGPADETAPAAAAGIMPGDVVVSIDGVATPSWDDVRQQIRAVGGREVDIVVEREGQPLTLSVTPVVTTLPALDDDGQVVLDEAGDPETISGGFLGVSPSVEAVRQPVWVVPGLVGDSLQGVAGVLMRLPEHLVAVGEAAFGGSERDPNGPVSVVGVSRFAGEITSAEAVEGYGITERTADLLGIVAMLNIALFVFNLVPLLPLDGGHAAGAVLEGVRKAWARLRALPDPGPVDVAKALPLAYGVAVLLLGMSALLIYADFVNPVRLAG